eukprot:169615_1
MAAQLLKVSGSLTDNVKVRRALISVSDKARLTEIGKFLTARGAEILSTGGSARVLREAGVQVTDVSDYTCAPEMMDGRVKTLHPRIHGGLLAVRGNKKHEADMKANGVSPIDMVVVNLYPFEKTVVSGGDFDTCIENIDIGGPSMIRSAAKNHRSVAVVTSVAQYDKVMAEMKDSGCTTLETRRQLACEAFQLTNKYDAAISAWFTSQVKL